MKSAVLYHDHISDLLGYHSIPVNGKRPQHHGVLGRNKSPLSRNELVDIAKKHPNWNVGLTLPIGVVGIDIDAYKWSYPDDRLDHLSKVLGVLPETISTSSREGISGIYLYRVPRDVELKSDIEGIDLIQWFQRFIMVSPSVHPNTSMAYSWRFGSPGNSRFLFPGSIAEYIIQSTRLFNDLEEPPPLPQGWLDKLRVDPSDMHHNQVSRPWDPKTFGYPCVRVEGVVSAFEWDIANGKSRHDSMISRQAQLVQLGYHRHDGVEQALNTLYTRFVESLNQEKDHGREYTREWYDAFRGAAVKMGVMHGARFLSIPGCGCVGVLDDSKPEETGEDDSEPDEGDEESQDRSDTEGTEVQENPYQVSEMLVRQEVQKMLVRDKAREVYNRIVRNDPPIADVSETLSTVNQEFEYGAADSGLWAGYLNQPGNYLFYRGRVNGVYGESSSGKSLMLAQLIYEELRNNEISNSSPLRWDVVHWEFDNNPPSTLVRRLLHMGLRQETISKHLFILYDPSALKELEPRTREELNITLVTLDAINPAIASLGFDLNQPEGVDMAVKTYFGPLVNQDSCGVFIDHVAHADKSRQSNTIRKSQVVQGALYHLENLGGGRNDWVSKMTLVKDNLHFVPFDTAYMQVSSLEDNSGLRVWLTLDDRPKPPVSTYP